MTTQKTSTTPFSHGDAETRRLIHRTEQNLRLLEGLGSPASTLTMGFGCVLGLNQWFYAPSPWEMTKNLFFMLAAIISTGDAVALANCVFGVFFALDDHVVCIA